MEAQIKIVDTRNDMMQLYPKGLIAMEIGVFKGEFSQTMLDILEPKELHLVDVFEGMVHSGDKDGLNVVPANLQIEYENVSKKFENHPNVFVHKCRSWDIGERFPNNYFDLIYVDGDHSYAGVTHDLELGFKKLRNRGILCGHDYVPRFAECVQAVDDFCARWGQRIDTLTRDGCVSFSITINK